MPPIKTRISKRLTKILFPTVCKQSLNLLGDQAMMVKSALALADRANKYATKGNPERAIFLYEEAIARLSALSAKPEITIIKEDLISSQKGLYAKYCPQYNEADFFRQRMAAYEIVLGDRSPYYSSRGMEIYHDLFDQCRSNRVGKEKLLADLFFLARYASHKNAAAIIRLLKVDPENYHSPLIDLEMAGTINPNSLIRPENLVLSFYASGIWRETDLLYLKGADLILNWTLTKASLPEYAFSSLRGFFIRNDNLRDHKTDFRMFYDEKVLPAVFRGYKTNIIQAFRMMAESIEAVPERKMIDHDFFRAVQSQLIRPALERLSVILPG